MRIRITCGPLLALILAAGLCAGTARGDSPAPSGEPVALTGVTILGSHDGAKVYVDDAEVATLPQRAPIALLPGVHSLRIVRLGFAPFQQQVRAVPGRVLTLEVELLPISGVLRIRCEPAGAAIFVDDQHVALAPAELELKTGPHTISVRHPGYYPEDFALPVSPGVVTDREVQLKPLPADLNPNRPVKIQVRPWYGRWWVWTLILGGAAILSTAIAVPAVVATRSNCDKLGAEVCFPIATQPTPAQTASMLRLGITF